MLSATADMAADPGPIAPTIYVVGPRGWIIAELAATEVPLAKAVTALAMIAPLARADHAGVVVEYEFRSQAHPGEVWYGVGIATIAWHDPTDAGVIVARRYPWEVLDVGPGSGQSAIDALIDTIAVCSEHPPPEVPLEAAFQALMAAGIVEQIAVVG